MREFIDQDKALIHEPKQVKQNVIYLEPADVNYRASANLLKMVALNVTVVFIIIASAFAVSLVVKKAEKQIKRDDLRGKATVIISHFINV